MQIRSKLPNLGTTIFSVMSAISNEAGAINLSQGFPNFDCDPKLKNLVNHYIQSGHNQYAPMGGTPELTGCIASKINSLYQQDYNPKTEITITNGATQGLSSAIEAFVHLGDEAIIIEPAYDSYAPLIRLCGALPVAYELKAPDWQIDWQEFAKLITDKTSLILINTPHNPAGIVFSDEDLQQLHKLVEGTNIVILSDEVYEHLTFDGRKHHSVLSYPKLRNRSLATFSFGKALHNTGWRIGYIVGDEPLMREFRKTHQFNVFSINRPIQHAIADYIREPETYLSLSGFFQQKRDKFLGWIKESAFKFSPTQGTYFQLVDYSAISEEQDTDFAIRMTREFGVAAIPVSVFYKNKLDNKVVRLCFAKTDEVLEQAAELLCKIR